MTQWEYSNDYMKEFAKVDGRHFVVLEHDTYEGKPFGCVVPPTIYGNDWHHPYGELVSCCKGVECPDWDTIRRALDHFGENVRDLRCADSVTSRYLRIFYGARAVSLLTSSIDRYAWAIVLVTDSWLDHIGTSLDLANDSTNFLEVQAYLNGEVYFVAVYRTEYPTTLDDYDSLEAAWLDASDCLETVGGYYGEDWAREGALELGRSLAGSFHPTYSEVRTITTTITNNGPAIMSETVRKVESA